MTNQSLRSLAISLTVLGCLLAGPAWPARVVEVRIGNHPTFTRVVFELDAKAGYEIERREVDGGHELVVTLSAASQPRTIASRSPMVAAVEIEPSGTEAVARVRLRRAAPLVKELILGTPPRIVLDLMLPEDLARAAAELHRSSGPPKPKPKSKPKLSEPGAARGAAAQPSPKAPLGVADETGPARPEAVKPAPQGRPSAAKPPGVPPERARPPEVAAPPKQQTTAAPEPREATAAPKSPEDVEPERRTPERMGPPTGVPGRAEPTLPVATPPATTSTPTPAARVQTALEGERVVVPRSEGAGDFETAGAAPVTPLPPVAKPPAAPPATPAVRAPAAPQPTAARSGWSLFGFRLRGSDPWLTFAIVGAGALLFLLVVVLLLRRHSRPTSLDALESMREPVAGADSFDAGSTSEFDAGREMGRETFPAVGRALFDDEAEKGDMDMAAQIPMERGRARLTPGPTGADSDPGPLVRELERRMALLESRLDQVNEARERLERQVTAQSEELRVQRAAIARTQRALRGMTRGDEATEPALRDPAKPPPGRA